MPNWVFDYTRDVLLGAGANRLDLDTDTIKAMFVDQTDITILVTHDFIDDITSGGRIPAIGSCPTLGSKTINSGGTNIGVFDAADTVFSALTGDQAEYLILFKDTGSEPTSNLIVKWDTATGLPLTPNGADVTVVWASGGILTV